MYFGTDGIRAKQDFFTDEFLERFASALFYKLGKGKVCVGRDTRVSGERIVEKLSVYLLQYGINIFDCGILPTPALAYLTKKNGCDLGIMISASHNPPEYNGIKLFSGCGAKLSKAWENALEEELLRPVAPKKAREGKICSVCSVEYEKYVTDIFNERLVGTRVLIDVCYGATALIAKRVFEALGCRVTTINDEYIGQRINVNCGATCLEQLIKCEKEGEYDIAFAYDGDGDRVICIKNGRVLNGDHIAYAYANYMDLKGQLSPRVVVGTLNSNLGLEKALDNKEIKLVRAMVGDRNVYEAMKKCDAKVGGESSGHVIFDGYGDTGDGILTSLIVCLMDKERGILNLIDMVDYPLEECFILASERDKKVFEQSQAIKEKISRMEKEGVRAVVRASGTEPKIRILVEAEQYETAREKANEIKEFISSIIFNKIEKEHTINSCLGIQNTIFKKANYDLLIKEGVSILAPDLTFIEEGVSVGRGSVIYPFNVIRGNTRIGKNVTIYSYCDITDTIIGDGVDVRSSYTIQAVIGEQSTVGPFATLRKGAIIGKGCRIGDYVEVKNSVLGDGVKSAHLSYIGDASIGARTNVGCGTVFANYNGKIKRKTEVGEGVFIGCNSNLIAPLKIGDNSYIAGGSTITEDIESNKFVIARTSQKTTEKR